MEYRLYLAGSDDHFRAAESFNAKDDAAAEEIALALYGNCSTSFHAIELWRGTDRIMRHAGNEAWPTVDLRKLIDRRQESVAQLEETLERGFQCVRESRQLIEALDKIRAR